MKQLKMIILLFLSFLLTSCSSEIDYTIGKSTTYSKEEIKLAMDAVKNDSKNHIQVATISSLTFDEKHSQKLIDNYLPTLTLDNYSTNTNTIVLNSTIKTGYFSGSLSSFTTYEDFYWVLVKKEEWQIVQSGFQN